MRTPNWNASFGPQWRERLISLECSSNTPHWTLNPTEQSWKLFASSHSNHDLNVNLHCSFLPFDFISYFISLNGLKSFTTSSKSGSWKADILRVMPNLLSCLEPYAWVALSFSTIERLMVHWLPLLIQLFLQIPISPILQQIISDIILSVFFSKRFKGFLIEIFHSNGQK